MLERAAAHALDRPRAVLRGGVLLAVLLSPLPFGSVQPWAVLSVELFAAAIGALALWIVLRDPHELSPRARALSIAALAVAVIGALQLLPAPAALTRWLAAPTAATRADVAQVLPEIAAAWRPLSLNPPATLDATLRWMAYALIALGAAVAFRQRRHLVQAAIAITASGAFQALYGAAEYLSGRQHIFGYAKEYFLDEATGTFINRNHFAGYLAITLPFALALVQIAASRRGGPPDWRARLLRLTQATGLRTVLGGLGAAVVWLGIILSYSRGGLAVALLAVALMIAASRRGFRLLALLLVLPTLFLMWQEVRAPGERFFPGQRIFSGRPAAWRTTVGFLPSYLVSGSGLGTFQDVFRPHQPPDLPFLWEHAHNDWLQSAVEGGLGTTAVLALGLFFALRRKPDGAPPYSRTWRSVRHATAVAIGVSAVHAVFDFSLRIPAVAILLAVCLGLRCTPLPDQAGVLRHARRSAGGGRR